MNKQEYRDSTHYPLYCRDAHGVFTALVSVIGKAERGITSPDYVLFTHNGITQKGFQKKDKNEINENDLECVLSHIANILSVPTAEVVRTYEDSQLRIPHSIISISVAQRDDQQFLTFSDMQDELFWDLSSGAIAMTPWIQKWISICNRRKQNPEGIWELYATSYEDCEATFQFPLEIASLWAEKHKIKLIDIENAIITMVLFDILIGQTDRGQGNYGLLVDWNTKTAKLAPLFDNATLKKPGLDEWLNGFNRLLVERDLFAKCAYNLWKDRFITIAKSFLEQEGHILTLLSNQDNNLSVEATCFLKARISSSINLLKQLIGGFTEVTTAESPFSFDEASLHEEIGRAFARYNLEPTQIVRLGEMSYEPKYHVQTKDDTYFVKFSTYDRFDPDLLEAMQTVYNHIPSLSIPLFSLNLSSIHRQINVYTWIPGTPLNEMIHSLPEKECYHFGIRCGHKLQNIHSIKQTNSVDTYSFENNLAQSMRILFERPDLLTHRNKYLPQMHIWMEKLKRPHELSLVHMDYVPKNLMVANDTIHVIDWDSCEVSDPWLDFFEKGLALYPERQAFNTGVIDGYFGGNVPSEFWNYFKALTVFALIRMSTWIVNQNNPTYVNLVEQHICDSYNNFTCSIPTWYIKYSNWSAEVQNE